MARLSPLLIVASFVIASLFARAQSTEDVLHAPDRNSREAVAGIFIPPLTNTPFQATFTLDWKKHLPDGTTETFKNHELGVRDNQGRIFRELRGTVPEGWPSRVLIIEISSPVTHTRYFCYPASTECELREYNPPPITQPVIPIGSLADGTKYLSRVSLGTEIMEGVEAIHTRETITTQAGEIGNSAPVDDTKEFWYSPKLGLNMQVLRLDPLRGDQLFKVTDLKLSEPDSHLFIPPAGYKVMDMREKAGAVSSPH